ncbi:MAG: penicillin-binding protein 2 [Verrucomicrobiales bacterium]|nr:penicillin-binding protein 2 [Verrucomicrobiales bacterium]
MDLARQRTRILWMGLLLVLAFMALGYRLVDLQVIQHEALLDRANRSHALQITTKGHRGDILDSRGEVLARSLPAKAICADPSLIGEHYTAVARVLAPLLRTNEAILAEILQPRLRTNHLGEVIHDRKGRPVTNQFVVLRRRVLDEDWRALSDALKKETFGLPTNRVREISSLRQSIQPSRDDDEIRVYPNRLLAGPVIGFTDGMGGGVEGLEAFLNEQLRGVDGFIKTERSRRGGELRRFREIQMPPQHGRDVFLTLDARLQLIVEEELAATLRQFQAPGGCAVAIQPRTGRILAMASLPGYDPNRPPLRPQDATLRRNWGVSYTFEPGSTFKLVAATAVMNEGLLDLTDRVDCGEHGQYVGEFGKERVRLSDVHVIKDRYATVERVIAESSNIGTFQLALKLGRNRYAEYLDRFGFGQKTGIRMPLEERGLLRQPKDWSMTDFSRIAMGYTVAVTPLQLAMAMSALANDGRLMRPQIIDRIVGADGTLLAQPEPEVVREVCRPEVAAKVRRALRQVVEDGTGALVKMERYTVAGKTGTAKIAPYREPRYHSSFVGFFPTEAPELCIAVVVEDPNPRLGYYGGKVSGPAFRNIATRAADYLGIQPDLPRPGTEPAEESSTALTSVRPKP